jgi:hypothetical protein
MEKIGKGSEVSKKSLRMLQQPSLANVQIPSFDKFQEQDLKHVRSAQIIRKQF